MIFLKVFDINQNYIKYLDTILIRLIMLLRLSDYD